jgi:hypothetical protein
VSRRLSDETDLKGDPTSSGEQQSRSDLNRAGGPNLWKMAASILAAVLIVLAVVLVLNDGALPLGKPAGSGNPRLIYIDGIDRDITYEGNITGDFGPGTNDSCSYCPVGAQAGGAIRIPLATWHTPSNLSFWVFTNVSGPFLVQAPSCSPSPCTLPWIKVWSLETYVPANTLSSMTLFATFQLPSSATPPNIIDLNASFCPSSICAPPP